MHGFWIILTAILLANVFWWRWASLRSRALSLTRIWQILIAVFVAGQLAYIGIFFLAPAWARDAHHFIPSVVLGLFYLWSLLILPATVVCILVGSIGQRVIARVRSRSSPAEAVPTAENVRLSRRQLLTAAAIATPPLLTGAGVIYGRRSLYDLRIRHADLAIANLPADLEGVTIAHISDTHVGKFVDDVYLRRVAEAANSLHADLHLLTGDLIDLSIRDLSGALDFVQRLSPKESLAMCEGNHDLIDQPKAFYEGVRARGVPLLVEDTLRLHLRGRPTPVQLLGTRWGEGAVLHDGVQNLNLQRHPDAFPILLAHHPHAFDAAAEYNFPLTLSGHTHGGLLMLSESVGAGPALYRYWSGPYTRGKSKLFVSNGIGSWFPLRTHARPEIVHLTLRRA